MTPFAGRLPRGPAAIAGAGDQRIGEVRRARFGVYLEADGLWSIHMAPATPVLLVEVAAALDLPGPLWDVTPRWRLRAPRRLDPTRLLLSRGPIEVVHGPDAAGLSDAPLLSDPQAVLPAESGRRLAFSVHDDHGVVLTRDPAVVRETVRAFVGGEVDEQAAWCEAPDLAESILEPLLSPIDNGAWRGLSLERRPAFWLLHLHAVASDESGRRARVEDRRWVGAPGIAWRDNWSW